MELSVQMFNYLKLFLAGIFVVTTVGCGGNKVKTDPNVKVFYPKTEVIVTYENREVHRVSKYIGLNKLKELMASEKEFIVIFSSERCSACKLTQKAIKQANLKTEVHYLNIEEKWAFEIAALMEIDSVPLMLHIDEKGSTKAQRLGPGKIVTYLLTRF